MVNNTIGESNVTCVICGKPMIDISHGKHRLFIWLFSIHTIELSGTTLRSLFASAVIVILFVGIRLVMKACQLCYEPKICIYDWMNFFEVSLYILSVIFVSVFTTPCLCPQKWQWQIGVVAILLAWINLIRFCAKFPSTGIYIIMFGHIVLTFLNVIVLSVLLLTTFAITFYMILSEALFQVSHVQRDPPVALVCIFYGSLLHTAWTKWRFHWQYSIYCGVAVTALSPSQVLSPKCHCSKLYPKSGKK